jgi:GNAT superfamily N-acetyltransferase
MIVRVRTDADLDKCEQLARVVHDLDGYPPYLPGDLRTFITSPDAIAAWVAEIGNEVVGHVALHPRTSAPVMALASEVTGHPAERFGVVARLLVSPGARREGAGRSLLLAAADCAVDRGLSPILDVATHFQAAITLYETCGWVRAGTVTVRFDDGAALDEFVYLAPRHLAAERSHTGGSLLTREAAWRSPGPAVIRVMRGPVGWGNASTVTWWCRGCRGGW